MSNLALKLISDAKSRNLKKLDLGKCSLTKLPESLFELKQLKSLILSNSIYNYQKQELEYSSNSGMDNKFENIDERIIELENLEELFLGGDIQFRWNISNLETLGKIKQLKVLDLSNNKVENLNQLKGLSLLEDLSVYNNEIESIEVLSNLKRLRKINLTRNNVKDFSILTKLKNLKSLHIKRNTSADFNTISFIQSLEELDLSSNGISDLDFLIPLKNLSHLNLRGNEVSHIKALENLENLKSLDLRSNVLHKIDPIKKLKNLISINLRNNRIKDISPLKNLFNLEYLDIGNNEIRGTVAVLRRLQNLSQLDISFNKINDISSLEHLIYRKKLPLAHFSGVQNKQWIKIEENPITNPPIEILYRSPEAIENYFKQLKEQGEDHLFEGKLLIVGEGGVGKTSLMRKLTLDNYPIPNKEENPTLGINVHNGWAFQINDKIFKANLWDFGGQEIQYNTHQFFLTRRSVYVVVLDARKEHNRLDYWLNIINLLGKRSPVLIVHNKLNSPAFKKLNFQKYIDRYKEKVDIGYLTVDLASEYDIDGKFEIVKETVQRYLSNLPQMGTYIPKQWIAVRNELQEILEQGKYHYISLNEYLSICYRNELIIEKDCLTLSGYLHDLGILLHYQEDPFLRDVLILNPKWALDAIYSLLMNRQVINNWGKFDLDTLSKIWRTKGYNFSEAKYLLQLMLKEKFEFCYKIESPREEKRIYFIPQLLQHIPPSHNWRKEKVQLSFIYKYPFMPKGIIHRLIVRMYDLIHYENGNFIQWNEGVILKKNNNFARIVEDSSRIDGLSLIKIELVGEKNQGKHFLHDIRNVIEDIHDRYFEKIICHELIPCPCLGCKSFKSFEPHFFELNYIYRKIKKFQEEKSPDQLKVECKNFLVEFSVEDILNTFLFKEEVKSKIYLDNISNERNIPKVYICHAQEDEYFKTRLDSHLTTLKVNRKIETWFHSKILPGDKWSDELEENLNMANIIILLISINMIVSPTINNVEMPKILERVSQRKSKLIPVIINHCDWQEFYQLGQYSFLPDNRVPISSWENEDAAWLNVLRGIKRLLQ